MIHLLYTFSISASYTPTRLVHPSKYHQTLLLSNDFSFFGSVLLSFVHSLRNHIGLIPYTPATLDGFLDHLFLLKSTFIYIFLTVSLNVKLFWLDGWKRDCDRRVCCLNPCRQCSFLGLKSLVERRLVRSFLIVLRTELPSLATESPVSVSTADNTS